MKDEFVGKYFGKLRVLEPSRVEDGDTYYKCICECGNIVEKKKRLLTRKTNPVRSCGCMSGRRFAKEDLPRIVERMPLEGQEMIDNKPNDYHGLSKTTEYATWSKMMFRCYVTYDDHYPNYGARGIKVCDRWHEFMNFYEDMHPRPANMTLDRIDVNGDYCKENCRWATAMTQANNRRSNRFITYNGETKTIAEWSRVTGINKAAILERLNKGLSPVEILTKARLDGNESIVRRESDKDGRIYIKGETEFPVTPDMHINPICRFMIEWQGNILPYPSWAKLLGISPNVIRNRIKYFMPIDKTLFNNGELLHVVERVTPTEPKF